MIAVIVTLPVTILAAVPSAGADVAWKCDAFGYLYQSPNGATATPHQVLRVDLATGAYSTVGTTTHALNAVGFNVLDDFYYAWDLSNNTTVRVNADLTLTALGKPSN